MKMLQRPSSVVVSVLIMTSVLFLDLSEVKGLSDYSSNLRVIISAGGEQCFYEEMKGRENVWIDYSVVGGTAGGLDINFQLSDPDGRPLVSEFKRGMSSTFISVKLPGVYKVCFDNSQSRFNEKTVSFQMTTKNASATNWEKYNRHDLRPEGVYDVQVEDIKMSMDRVRVHVNEIQLLQDNHRMTEARDRSIGESNFERVNFWSALFIIATLIVLGIQTFAVRMFFEDKQHMFYQVCRELRRGATE